MHDQECPEKVEGAAAVQCCAIAQEGDQDTESGKLRTSVKNSICEQKRIFLPACSVPCPTVILVVTSGLTPCVFHGSQLL